MFDKKFKDWHCCLTQWSFDRFYADKSNVFAVSYFTAVDLGDDDYELDLMDFTYYTLANINSTNNKFY